jgi:rSAM/selenodomain-associated transferase 1
MIFAKAPVAGRAKTRLIPLLGEQGAADMQARLLRHVIVALAGQGDWQTQLWCAPSQQHKLFQNLASEFDVSLHDQVQGHLGERMCAGFEHNLSQSNEVLIVGTDCPLISVDKVRASFDQLVAGYEAAITPAEDGGYVMLGLSRPVPQIFAALPWGSDKVFAMTEKILQQQSINYALQPELWDVDRPEDVLRLRQQLSGFA